MLAQRRIHQGHSRCESPKLDEKNSLAPCQSLNRNNKRAIIGH